MNADRHHEATSEDRDGTPVVLVYRSVLLPHSETFIREQALSYRSWRPIIVGRKLVRELSLDGLAVRILDSCNRRLMGRIALKLRNGLGRADGAAALRGEKPQALHAHFGPDAVEAAPLARALGVPMFVTLHGFDIMIDRWWWESGAGGADMRSYPKALLKLAAQPDVHFVAVSKAIMEAAKAFGIPAEKLSVRYIGIDSSRFKPGGVPIGARHRRVLFVGRLVEKKGCEYLVKAMRIVSARLPDAKLVIIGDGPLRVKLEHLAQRLGVPAEFIGTQEHDRVKAELDAARVLCLPSVRATNGDAEGFGLVLLEAQATGVPVVSSAHGGADEGILEGVTGFRVAERDINAMADRLADVLADHQQAASMAAAGPTFVAQYFDVRRCTAQLEQLYEIVGARCEAQREAV
jgi:glucosyltransferase